MPKGTGFTLIELITSVAIIGIITAIATPSFNNLVIRTHLERTTSDFVQSLALARTKAAYLHTKVAVIPEGAEWGNGWTVYEDINSDGKINQNETVFFRHGPINNSLQIHAGGTIANYIAYIPNGYTARRNNAYLMDSLFFCAPGAKTFNKKLIINFSGRVRIEDIADSCAN
ncbi:MAG: putative type-4 fimbrial pilin related signal peptide protein [Verrucomicrobiaceae bacterium]|nr:putative type-4 fimbrial pilin related signal peptide protein [Verrucomicrobiaceae bacterium]